MEGLEWLKMDKRCSGLRQFCDLPQDRFAEGIRNLTVHISKALRAAAAEVALAEAQEQTTDLFGAPQLHEIDDKSMKSCTSSSSCWTEVRLSGVRSLQPITMKAMNLMGHRLLHIELTAENMEWLQTFVKISKPEEFMHEIKSGDSRVKFESRTTNKGYWMVRYNETSTCTKRKCFLVCPINTGNIKRVYEKAVAFADSTYEKNGADDDEHDDDDE